MHINDNILKAREARGLKQDQVAKLIEVSRSTYAEWERDIIPKADVFYRFCRALKFSPDDILTEGWKPDEISADRKGEEGDSAERQKKLHSEDVPEYTHGQILSMLARAYDKQADTLNIQAKWLERIEANSTETLAGVRSLSKRQKGAIADIRKDLDELKSRIPAQRQGSGKSPRQNGGEVKKKDTTP